MRKIFKKAMSFVASVAMVVGMIASVGTTQAQAATKTTTIHVKAPEAWTSINMKFGVGESWDVLEGYETFKNNEFGEAITDNTTLAGYYTVSLNADDTTVINGLFNNGSWGAGNQTGNFTNLALDGSEYWCTIDGQYTASFSKIDPSAITASDVVAAINEIGTVTLDSKAKIEAAETAVANYLAVSSDYKTDDISNYSTLTKARKDYDDLVKAEEDKKKAEDAAAAGELTVYVKAPENWEAAKLWAWTSTGDLFEAWPGEGMTACENNDGWYKATIKTDGKASIIFNNGDGEQTKNIEDLVAGVYWFELVMNEGETQYDAEVSKDAPNGWEDEEKAEIETEAKDDNNDDDKEDTDKDNDDKDVEEETDANEEETTTPSVLKVTAVVPASLGWNEVYLYAWTDDGEIAKWPGTKMTLKDGKYVLEMEYVADKMNFIVTNGDGEQTVDITDVNCKSGAVEITVSTEKDENGHYKVATVAQTADNTPFAAAVATVVLMGIMVFVLNARKEEE